MAKQETENIAEATQTVITALDEYVSSKLLKNGSGGRPHFIVQLKKQGFDPKEEILNIFDAIFLKQPNRSIGNVAKQYKTGYLTIARILQDCEPFKNDLIIYLQQTPRRKRFFNKELETSDYETVQTYIKRAKRDGLVRWKQVVGSAEHCWRFLNYRDPATWTADDVTSYLQTLTDGAAASMIDKLRMVAPQLREKGGVHEVKVGRYRMKLMRRKKRIFSGQIRLIIEALKAKNMGFELLIFLLHVALGAREGSHGVDRRSGMIGLTWDRFHENFTLCDDYESKVHGGIWWRDCPLNLLFPELPQLLRELWIKRGKPITDKVLLKGYEELQRIYGNADPKSQKYGGICKALAEYYDGKLDPALFKEITTIHPHDADKIHVNLLWEAEVPIEIVAGQYEGGNEGIGLVGRGWLNSDIIKKYYLSLTRTSQRFQKIFAQIKQYSQKLINPTIAETPTLPILENKLPEKVEG